MGGRAERESRATPLGTRSALESSGPPNWTFPRFLLFRCLTRRPPPNPNGFFLIRSFLFFSSLLPLFQHRNTFQKRKVDASTRPTPPAGTSIEEKVCCSASYAKYFFLLILSSTQSFCYPMARTSKLAQGLQCRTQI